MQISIKQDELEVAVRDYIMKCGITRAVGDISFTATRSGADGIVTSVEVTDKPVSNVANIRSLQTTDATIAPLSDTDADVEAFAADSPYEPAEDAVGPESSSSLFS